MGDVGTAESAPAGETHVAAATGAARAALEAGDEGTAEPKAWSKAAAAARSAARARVVGMFASAVGVSGDGRLPPAAAGGTVMRRAWRVPA